MNFLKRHLNEIVAGLGADWTAEYDENIVWCRQAVFRNSKTGVAFVLRGQTVNDETIVKFSTFPVLPKIPNNTRYVIGDTLPPEMRNGNYNPNFTAGIKDDNPRPLINALLKRTIAPLNEAWPYVEEYVEIRNQIDSERAALAAELKSQGYRIQPNNDTAYSINNGVTVQLSSSSSVCITDRIYCTPDQLKRINAILREGK